MKTKQILKIITDVFMTVLLLLLMAYSLIGETAHEWLGVGVFLMFVLHHILNIKWCRNLFRGKYPPIRIFGTALVMLVFLSMAGSMISGILFVCAGYYFATMLVQKGKRKIRRQG